MMDLKTFLGGITPEEFLKEYWCKKPLLIKAAVKNTEEFLTVDNMRELALDETVESRMVLPVDNDKNWICNQGPFEEADFKNQEEKNGTLICHGLNLYGPMMAKLEELTRFIPNWQFDDIMVTHSYSGEGVGAHIDDYNVFILQGHGKKKWLLEEDPDPTYDDSFALRILKNFNPNIEWELEPGDMVYIPPSVAHHGVALTEGMSYSIGFKAFKYEDMFSGFFQHHLETSEELQEAYNDRNLEVTDRSFRINNQDVDKMIGVFEKHLFNREIMGNWMGSYVTEPREVPEKNDDLSFEEFVEEFKEGRPLYQETHTRFASMNNKVFINGKAFDIEEDMTPLFEKAFSALKMDEMPFERNKLSIKSLVNLHKAYELGAIYFSD
jgi:50S ribosomal protein L16 3-hydroxylase